MLLSQASKFYKRCSSELAKRLKNCFEELEQNPFSGPNIKQLKAKKKLYRYRIGDHRVIYEIDKNEKRVGIFLISPRPSAYRNI
ncbi:MAG: type II toxin-antitoxin system RelE/ParE family toxin [Candidatus Omnitrophica bacterium]|nr:type II toxin-antitoxin system RelE/ParE family toxin [Candidatus Omnitrophota bacterium]